MVEKTNIYFLAEITRNYGNGDCILLENIDINGNILHALIDTGRRVYDGVVCKFLKKHNVKKLEFLLITHMHIDHNGDAISVIENFEIDALIMKEYDAKWSPDGTQKAYEDIITKAIEKKIKKILGVSYESLISEIYSPSLSDKFRKEIIKLALKDNFEYFNPKNINFKLGSADIQIINWEIFDSNGNLFVPKLFNAIENNVITRDKYNWENCNSLGVKLTQGNKKAFFSGDMNNIPKKVGKNKIGDEDRLKNIIGKIDLLKLGHHGYHLSNTKNYLNVLKPEYIIITNDIGGIFMDTAKYLEKNKLNYLYSTYDQYEVSATITNDNIFLGFGTKGIKQFRDKIYYIKEENIYKNYLEFEYKIKYNIIDKEAKSWDDLKNIIENQNIEENLKIEENTIILESLRINLSLTENQSNYFANSQIKIDNNKKIILISNESEIIIQRGQNLLDFPLFYVENSCLILGEPNMKGKIKIDGNKNNVASNSNLIKIIGSEYFQYPNVILCNNLNRTTKSTKKTSNLILNKIFGSAIYSINSKMNIFGGEICDNIHEIVIDENNNESRLPEIVKDNLIFSARGAGIYMIRKSILNMYDGKIINNKGINNSKIFSNINSSSSKSKEIKLEQQCQGIGICANQNCQIYLHKGEISNNIAINAGKIMLKSPGNNKKNKIHAINTCIYGTAIFIGNNSSFQMGSDVIISNNTCEIKSDITIKKDSIVNELDCCIRGGQIYSNKSTIKIEGGLIKNGKCISKIKKNIDIKNIKVSDISQGGGINFINCKNMEINNLQIVNCNSDKGGGLFLTNCSGKISNSIFESNQAKSFGGGMLINKNSDIELINNKILNNRAETQSGGGIYAFGKVLIDGEETLISDNLAETYGGGIMIKEECTIKNGKICHNKALNNSGGGIRIDGKLHLINGKICKNWCNLRGGGINYQNAKKFTYDDKNVEIYKNNSNDLGKDIFPLENK